MPLNRRSATALLAAMSLGNLDLPSARAESNYPDRPVKLIVPYPPGGGSDLFARVVSPAMSEALGQPVVVDNKPGASGMIAASAVARQLAPDGNSLLLSNKAILAINPFMYEKAPYGVSELEPVSLGGRFDFLLVVNPQVLPVRAISEIVAESLRSPIGLNYASPGVGITHDFAMELFVRASGAKLTKISYKGGGPAVRDLLAGHVSLMFMDRATARPYIDSGNLRAIAAAGSKRISMYPDVPTVAEAGLKDFAIDDWIGFSVRKGTSPEAVQKLGAAFAKAASSPAVRDKLNESGIVVTPGSATQFADFIQRERADSKDLITRLNIKLE